MKHKHYEMIVAKAANMDLETFISQGGGGCWSIMTNAIPVSEQFEYFLCLPQHKEACLHWLNGGELQINRKGHGFLDWDRPSREWKVEVSFMFDINEFRIKPKKEKRWIAYDEAGDCFEQTGFGSLKEAEDQIKYSDVQFIEIEVEV